MITVIKTDKKKPEGLKTSAQVWNQWKRIYLSFRHQVEVRERLVFENELATVYEEVQSLVEHQPRKCKDWRESMRPISPKRGLTPDENLRRRNVGTSMLELQQIIRKKI